METAPAYVNSISTKFDEDAIHLGVKFTKYICVNNECIQPAEKFCLILIPKTSENIESCCAYFKNNDKPFNITFDLDTQEIVRTAKFPFNRYIGAKIEPTREVPNRPLDQNKSIFQK